MEPRHRQRTRCSRAAAHRRASFRVLRERHVIIAGDPRQHFGLDEGRVRAGHGVVFEAALATLRIAAAVVDEDGDHHREALLVNHVVENRGNRAHVFRARSILHDDERRSGAGHVLRRHIHADAPFVRHDDARLCFLDAGINPAVRRLHGELVNRAFGHARPYRELRRRRVRWRDDRVAAAEDGGRRRRLP